ncbi:hypothetical protein BCR35DRAFT_324738 [Leucosporidium creatinivorum]|uniref:Uncharacterized protein n=1 Tax=Leucosporidium creatinivorum TaxID=106004 RepID=A0A1Y2FMT7_9BASI|nr:hypothetical protein BCR35DRAFT_324738 [Leucosporidium creatinivorum]
MATPQPVEAAAATPASLAKRLYDICDSFAEVASAAEGIDSDHVWEEISGAFSTASLQSLLAPETSALAVDWRRKLENWIGDQLQAKWRGGGVSPATDPPPQPPVGPSPLAYGLQAPQPATPASFLASSAGSPFASYPAYEGSNGSFSAGHSPSNSMDSPLMSATPYANVPSPFLSPFHFPAPMYYAPPVVNGLPVQLTPPTTLGPGPGFGELEVDHRFDMGLIDFANSFGSNQTQLPQPQPPVLDPQVTRRPSPVTLPRLVTTDLSPSTNFNASPTINISRSPTPEPGFEHGRSRSLSASGPSTPGHKTAHHRRLSSGASSPRFHPFITTPKSTDNALLAPDPSALLTPESPGSLLSPGASPSSMMAELALSSPHSPASSTGDGRVGGSHKRSRSSETRSRAARTIAYDENAVFLKNDQHVFVVHTQTRTKTEITEADVLEIDLDSSTPSTSALHRAIHEGQPYGDQTLLEECTNNTSYAFTSTRAGATNHWLVSFSLDPSAPPTSPRPLTTIAPRLPQPNLPADAIFTFVHFVPGTIVVSPTYPMGASKWWRVQECPGRHENCPGDGSWTARWDEEGEERRPSRVVQHYASCSMRRVDGDSFALGKLARAVRKTKPKM